MLNKNIKSYVINLDKRVDRISELKLPLEWERFSATDGQKYVDNIPKERGWRGCYDSHVRLIEKTINDDAELFIIFEDDVEVTDNFMDKLETIINNVPENWELLFLGGWNVGEKIKINDYVDLAEKVYCMHAYMFKPETAKKLLNKFKNRVYKIDVLLCELLPDINAYICNPTLAWQRPGFSNIEYKETDNTHLK
jgi:GR25 family glycosyltransferase involved in LPS biosynthesis